MSEQTCGNCRHWRHIDTAFNKSLDVQEGLCARFPPQIAVDGSSRMPVTRTSLKGCGEYSSMVVKIDTSKKRALRKVR